MIINFLIFFIFQVSNISHSHGKNHKGFVHMLPHLSYPFILVPRWALFIFMSHLSTQYRLIFGSTKRAVTTFVVYFFFILSLPSNCIHSKKGTYANYIAHYICHVDLSIAVQILTLKMTLRVPIGRERKGKASLFLHLVWPLTRCKEMCGSRAIVVGTRRDWCRF